MSEIGQYEIIEQIGVGGMATVYKAHQPKLDRYVAVKVLHKMFLEDAGFTARFEREARIVASLDHPNIVPIYDYDEHEGQPYLIMKYIQGQTLKERLQAEPLSLDEVRAVMGAVCDALSYAHDRGVLHRDMKPSNILIDADGTPYLTDFGLARIAQQGESTLSVDTMLGTPHYISPEQAEGRAELDARTDVYATGIILYELMTGRLPFTGEHAYAIIHKQINAAPPVPSRLNPELGLEIDRVLLKALAKSPADRYPTPNALMKAFERAVSGSGLSDLDAARAEKAAALGELISQHTPGGSPYDTASRLTVSPRGKRAVIVPVLADPSPPDLTFGEWFELVVQRIRRAIEDIREQLRQRNLRDRIDIAVGELQSSVENLSVTPPPVQQQNPERIAAPVADESAVWADSQTGTPIIRPAPEKQRRIRRDWSMEPVDLRRRARARTRKWSGLYIHMVIFAIAMVAFFGVQAGIESAITEGLTDSQFIADNGQAVSDALLPLAQIPWMLGVAIMWGTGLISHALSVYNETGLPLAARRRRIDRRMTRMYGEHWRETATDRDYRPVKKEIEKGAEMRVGFWSHTVSALMLSVGALILLPMIEPIVIDAVAAAGNGPIPVTNWAAFFALFMWITVGIHALGLFVGTLTRKTTGEDALQREIERERRLSGYTPPPKEKRKTAPPEAESVRLTGDGEFTDSFIDEINRR